ncbi:hypothetical protein EVAR_36448_1 [Eumeta japonica]|uniref:Uncharacterized protein n=1 Tax=Eumeta variegata TaxID=151549 RepID=A0A4C1VQP6_EUMVA|nr:hypothetical protein EVAR_36448_1 [Eumeta japonica]
MRSADVTVTNKKRRSSAIRIHACRGLPTTVVTDSVIAYGADGLNTTCFPETRSELFQFARGRDRAPYLTVRRQHS